MADSPDLLEERLKEALVQGYRGRLLDRGLARGLIWVGGVIPDGSPNFSPRLTADLLDYGHALLSMALRLRIEKPASDILGKAFEVAGEAFEAAVHRGSSGMMIGFHRVCAATSYHLARLSARAFSILPATSEAQNFSPTELAIGFLIQRNFDALHELSSSRLLDERYRDEQIARRLESEEEFEADDAIHEVLLNSFMTAIAWFEHALATGSPESAAQAKRRMFLTANAASDLRSVNHWWTATLAAHLIDEVWGMSFHTRIPLLPDEGSLLGPGWNQLRLNFIQRLRASKRAAIDLWPSQLAAASRAIDPDDDLVVALPTSAGKTRIAELCILRTLASGVRVIYVTPLRALSAQIERDLAETFLPLGFSVSSLYGSAGVEAGDRQTLVTGDIVVATPEKLDFAIRNDPSIIDDVGLIVFDEGHMLGKGEREVRYETLVQRILRRSDAGMRRIVCLSALFPNPEDMKHLVGWIRQDEAGDPIHSHWRPTRQRFGTIEWSPTAGKARLEIAFSDEKPFVPGFLEVKPPVRGGRRNPFPHSKQELVLGVAWKFVEQGKRVLIYCSEKRSVGPLGRMVLTLIRQGMVTPLVQDTENLRNARAVGEEWLGADHPAVQCLKYGVALHHASLPRQFLSEVEELLKKGECLLTIASPTLAQGLNLSASVLLVPSIIRNRETIPASEFANVAGRAGRAFVDLEGLILHVVWESGNEARKAKWKWEKLVREAKAPLVESGILKLAFSIFQSIASKAGLPEDKVMEYLTGYSMAWDFLTNPSQAAEPDPDWERELASLDSAILGLIDPDASQESIDGELKVSLEGSLPVREATSLGGQSAVDWLFGFLALRARDIWSKTDGLQRRGFYTAGIGLKAGLSLHGRLDELVGLMIQIEAGILMDQTDDVPAAVVAFAEIVFGFAPFAPYKGLPANWSVALSEWMRGSPLAAIVRICGEAGVDLLQDALAYRLPWAMEAVRVHCAAVGNSMGESLVGLAAQAVETGSMNQSVILLINHGLQSRDAARIAVQDTGAAFTDENGMRYWLNSEEVRLRSQSPEWPAVAVRYSWMKFYQKGVRTRSNAWARKDFLLEVEWSAGAPVPGTDVILTQFQADGKNQILSPGYTQLGTSKYGVDVKSLVRAWVGVTPNHIYLQYYGSAT